MGFFDDMGAAAPTGDGSNRLKPGRYDRLVLTECTVHQGFHGTRFIAAFDVIESSGPEATPVGMSGDWAARIDGQWGHIGMGDVKVFVSNLTYVPEEMMAKSDSPAVKKFWVDLMARVMAGEFNGTELRSDAYAKNTNGGQTMVKHTWENVNGAPQPGAAPDPAAAPPPPPVPPTPTPFPPAGWTAHPTSPGWYYRGQEVVSEADLRARG